MNPDPVSLMTTDPGGFYVYPAGQSMPALPSTTFVYDRPQSFPIVERYSGDPFAAPVAFRPSTDRFLDPTYDVPALLNYRTTGTVSGSQYAASVVTPATVPRYRTSNGVAVPEVVPARSLKGDTGVFGGA